MNPQDITKAYEEQLSNAPDYTNALIERAGAAQENMGTLAANAMTGSQTAGVGNYTYNRVARPAVDSMVSTLQAEAMSQALNRQLAMALQQAQRNHDLARLNFAKKGGGGGDKKQPGDDIHIREEVIDPDADRLGDFSNWGRVPGQVKKYPMNISTPLLDYAYEDYTRQYETEGEKAEAWLALLNKLGYKGN